MEARQKVYQLAFADDDPRFAGFDYDGDFSDPVPPRPSSRHWRVRRLAPTWKPLKLVGRVRSINDFPTIGGRHIGVSQRAVEAMGDLLEPNGELLPVRSPQGKYWLYNVTTVADVLDVPKSKIKWHNEFKPRQVLFIEHFEFKRDALADLSIFRIVEEPMRVFVTEKFVRRVQEHGFGGLIFYIVWPLPANVRWNLLKPGTRARQLRQGLPEGQSLKGNTLVLRLPIKGRVPSATERKRVEALMDRLDLLFFERDSAKPAVGSVEGFDHVPGECRVFLSCPDANALAKYLLPWLRELDWPGNVRAVKRYGEIFDGEAREEQVEP